MLLVAKYKMLVNVGCFYVLFVDTMEITNNREREGDERFVRGESRVNGGGHLRRGSKVVKG